MNLDKYIRMQLIILSKKYDISIVELTTARDGKISRHYTVNYRDNKYKYPKEEFYSKRELVQWLLKLE